MTAPNPKLDELVAVLARLRAPGGCAWDREQTHESLVKHLIEETHELVEAIESGDRDQLIEELGDVLYQVIFHSDLAAHTPGEEFTLEDVAEHMSAKMISRHPHVFGDTVAETSADVVAAWDRLKAVEKPERTSVLDGIPAGMPSLLLAEKVLGRAAKVGVSVPVSTTGSAGSASFADENQLGAVLLGIVASARSSGLDAERALRGALRGLQNEVRAVEAGD
ncbi:MazG family protein [Marisediminicola senii]|uniref:MazG family protein n=1 Tax=Marisediminicola senii TaxID=2711233 RepID=UPI0013EA1A42|nr:MazG family protein [Marisediminicola senii]